MLSSGISTWLIQFIPRLKIIVEKDKKKLHSEFCHVWQRVTDVWRVRDRLKVYEILNVGCYNFRHVSRDIRGNLLSKKNHMFHPFCPSSQRVTCFINKGKNLVLLLLKHVTRCDGGQKGWNMWIFFIKGYLPYPLTHVIAPYIKYLIYF